MFWVRRWEIICAVCPVNSTPNPGDLATQGSRPTTAAGRHRRPAGGQQRGASEPQSAAQDRRPADPAAIVERARHHLPLLPPEAVDRQSTIGPRWSLARLLDDPMRDQPLDLLVRQPG